MKHSPRPWRLSSTLSLLILLGAPPSLVSAATAAPEGGQETSAQKKNTEKAPAESTPRRRLGPDDGETSLVRDDQEIRITWEKLKVDSRDYPALEELGAGETFAFSGGRAVKLLTDFDLLFGDVEIPRGNASPDYPGVYSLWLRRTPDGWSLVFNSDADIWGTQRLPDRDAGEVPLDHRPRNEEASALTLELVDGGDSAGRLSIAWGNHEWFTSFLTMQP